jgi:hypothetical protein
VPAAKPKPATAKRFATKTPKTDEGKSATDLIDQRIAELADWRGELLGNLRALIRAADPGVKEEWKWNTPV